jgi:predicted hydrocarbon binding protein
MTAAKYLDVMHAKKLIDCKKVGTSKLWIPSERTLDRTLDLIIEYFYMYNSAVNEYLGAKKFEIIHEIGIRIGRNIYEKYFPKEGLKSQKFSNLVEFCAYAMNRVYPIPSQVKSIIHDENTAEVLIDPCICKGIAENKSLCEMQTGIIIGISQPLFKNLTVEEKECMCDGQSQCSYIIKYSP